MRAINGLKNLFSTVWSFLTFPYRAIRRLIFIFVYPAPFKFNPGSEKYNSLRDAFICQQHYNNAQVVTFDLQANMYADQITEIQRQDTSNRYFDAARFSTDLRNFYNVDKQFIIMAGGNATCYEEFAAEASNLTDRNTNVICFNPMGVGISPGITNGPEDYQAAIKSIIDNLHKNGIPHDNIVLQGQSLGAAMCLVTAEQYQARGERVKVIADRTFARLDNTAATMLWVLYIPVKLLINLFGLNIYAATAFNNINNNNPGDAVGLSVDNDGVIPASCNLYNGVNTEARQQGFVNNFYARPPFSDYPAHNISADYIEKNHDIYADALSGTTFMRECRSRFKAQMSSKDVASSAFLGEETDRFTPNTPTITPLKATRVAQNIATASGNASIVHRRNNRNYYEI